MNPWSRPQTVAGFVQSPPNATLMAFADRERARGAARLLDIGCGAARNAVPLARSGWTVLGTDTSWPMLEAARAARPGAALFLFTFSRHTLPPDAEPVPGEPFVFTQFSGEPQCFLTDAQIAAELAAAGFTPDPALPLRELTRPAGLRAASGPVIYEGVFRRL